MNTSTPQDGPNLQEDVQMSTESSSLPTINEHENSEQSEIERPRGHLSSNLCSTLYSFIGSLSSKKNNSRGELIEREEEIRVYENSPSRETFGHQEQPVSLGTRYEEQVVTEIRQETPRVNQRITFQNNEYTDRINGLFTDQPNHQYDIRSREIMDDIHNNAGGATYAIEKLHLNENFNNDNVQELGLTHPENIERHTDTDAKPVSNMPFFRALESARVLESGGIQLGDSYCKKDGQQDLRGRQIWNGIQNIVNGDREFDNQFTFSKKSEATEESPVESSEPQTVQTSEQGRETSSLEQRTEETIYYQNDKGRYGGQVSEFTTDDVENALNLEQKPAILNDIMAEKVAEVQNEIQKQQEEINGTKEHAENFGAIDPSNVHELCKELIEDGANKVTCIEKTVEISIEVKQPDIQVEENQKTKQAEKPSEETKPAAGNVRKQVTGARGGPKRVEVQKTVKGKEQKETSMSRWKAPLDKKPIEVNIKPMAHTRIHSESVVVSKSKKQQGNNSIRVELKKERMEISTKSSSAVLNRQRDSSSNSTANARKRKIEDVPLTKSLMLKKAKMTNPNDENNKITMFKHHGLEKPKIEMTKVVVERKTMERGGLATKDNESEKKVVSKGGCVFCNGVLIPKNEVKMLSCLHKAHTKCYDAMNKKKNSQCPACNSNNAPGEGFKKGGFATTSLKQ